MVDLGGYIIILTNDDGKIKLYGTYSGYVSTNDTIIRQIYSADAKYFTKHMFA